jgi:outer membrane protein
MRALLTLPLALLWVAPAQARSLSVEQAVELALEQDLSIEAAEAAERAAEAEAQKALLALFPSLSSSAGWTRLGEVPYVEFDTSAMFGGGDTGGSACEDISEDDLPAGFTLEMAQAMCEMIMGWMAPDTSAGPVILEMGLQNNYFAQLTLEQVLFAGGAMHQARRATKDFHRASVEGVRYARHAAAYNTEQLFYGVVMARQAAQLTQQAHELVQAYEQTLVDLVEAGVASRADLLATQAQASQAKLDAMKAAHGARLAEATFKATLRLPMDEPLELVMDTEHPGTLPAERERLLDLALRRRPEINQLGYSLDGMDHLANAAWASWLPAVIVQGNLAWKNPNYALEQEWYRSTTLTVAASWTLWDKGAGLLGHKAAQANWAQLRAQREQLERMLEVEVEMALSSYDESIAELAVARIGLEQAQESLRLEQDRFEQGMVNNTELLAAQTALSGAQLAVLQAETGIHLAHASLRKSVGDNPEVTP